MIFDHTGNQDMSLKPRAHLTVPDGFKWPATVKKLTAAHRERLGGLVERRGRPARSAGSLEPSPHRRRTTPSWSKPSRHTSLTPANTTEDKARRAALYAEEVARQAAVNVETAILAIRAALPAHRANLITQACTLEREAIAARVALMTEAQALVTQATAIGHHRLPRQLGPRPARPARRRRHRLPHTEEVQWLRPWQVENHAALAALDRLERVAQPQPVVAP